MKTRLSGSARCRANGATLRHAPGAVKPPRREILWQFLIEALVISGAGALAGIAVAVSLPILVRPVMPGNLTVPISAVSVVVAFAVSCLTGVFFGYLPASRAARLQPTESLRYE